MTWPRQFLNGSLFVLFILGERSSVELVLVDVIPCIGGVGIIILMLLVVDEVVHLYQGSNWRYSSSSGNGMLCLGLLRLGWDQEDFVWSRLLVLPGCVSQLILEMTSRQIWQLA